MRLTMVHFSLILLLAASAEAQDASAPPQASAPSTLAAPGKDAVTDLAVIKTCGGDLAKMYSQFGPPSDLVPARGDTENMDRVLCDYESYMFGLRDQKIQNCFFRQPWKGPILGIKMGDSREDVVKVLGVAPTTFKDKNGVITDFGYPMKDLGVEFYANFDNAGKLKRVEIEPLK